MASVIHIAEVAAILAVAYVLGWVIGYFAHRLLARKPDVVADVAAERIAAVTAHVAAEDALVKAPVIEPVAATPAPEPPPPEPEPAPIAPTVVAAEPEPVAAEPEVPATPMSAETTAILPPVEIPSTTAGYPLLKGTFASVDPDVRMGLRSRSRRQSTPSFTRGCCLKSLAVSS